MTVQHPDPAVKFDAALDAIRRECRCEAEDEIDPAWFEDLDRDSQPDCGPVLPLWSWLEDQSSWYHMTGTTQGAWLAGQLAAWAALARALGTETAGAFAAKCRQLEAMRGDDTAEWTPDPRD